MSGSKPIPITTPYLPPLEEYVAYLRGIWERAQLTNHGPLALELEHKLQEFLGIDRALLVANGALGLHLALRALDIRGTVITTPFSYVATTSCPLWEGNDIVFADIEAGTLTIDPAAVEASIRPDTEAILATHVYGNPCDVEALQQIADRHGLAVIYDAAHAFGVRYRGRSILEYGHLSMVSLHATKLFHTAEGGLMAGRNREALDRIEWMRRFGHNGEEAFWGVGTNAKLSELHAAMGLAILPKLPDLIERRRQIASAYDAALAGCSAPVQRPAVREGTEYNYAYYPILLQSEEALRSARAHMANEFQVMTRRYFYPSLDQPFPSAHSTPLPVSNEIARRILCLPLASAMDQADVEHVCQTLVRVLAQ